MDAQVKNYVNTHLSGDSQRGFHATDAAKAVGLKKGSQLAKFLKDNKIEMEAFKALYTHTPQTHLNDLQNIVQDFATKRNVQVLKGVTDAVKSEAKVGEARVEASDLGKAAYQGDIQFEDFRKDILEIQDLANGGNQDAADLLDYLNNNFLFIYNNGAETLDRLNYAEAAIDICITHADENQRFDQAALDGLTTRLWNEVFAAGQPGAQWYAMTGRQKEDFLTTVTEFKGIFTNQLNNPPANADAGKIAVARQEINEKLNTIDARALTVDGEKYPLELHIELQAIVDDALNP